jgi:hypothetical protein
VAGEVRISKEYKDHDSGLYRYRTVKRGRDFHGEIREYKVKVGGRQLRIYWAARLRGEYFMKDESWCIDKAVYNELMMGFCITHIGILVTIDSKRKISDQNLIEDYWLIKKEDFDAYRVEHDYSGVIGKSEGAKRKLGSLQWKVPMNLFSHRVVYIPDHLRIKEMMVSVGRRAIVTSLF